MCTQCNAIAINGVNCHETGCPNSWRNPLTDKPYPKDCKECGCEFTPEVRGQYCCSEECYNFYNGW